MSEAKVDNSKRTWLIASGCMGAVGAVFTATPFVESFEPSQRAKAAGAPVEVDISGLKAGDKMTVAWRGQPVWIIRRTAAELAQLPKNDPELADPKSERPGFTPVWAKTDWRSIKPEYLVIVGICTHLGCTPDDRFTPGPQPSLPSDWPGGFLCPCHGSTYDMSGRVFKNKPAPDNMLVPPYTFLSDSRLLIGEHDKAKA